MPLQASASLLLYYHQCIASPLACSLLLLFVLHLPVIVSATPRSVLHCCRALHRSCSHSTPSLPAVQCGRLGSWWFSDIGALCSVRMRILVVFIRNLHVVRRACGWLLLCRASNVSLVLALYCVW
jgi:hypothetical protein